MAAVQAIPDPDRNTAYHCVCGHYFDEPDEATMLVISFHGWVDEATFDIDEYKHPMYICPECGYCCNMAVNEEERGEVGNDDLHDQEGCDSDNGCSPLYEAKWICLGCAKIYETESDAVDCCP